MTESEKPADSEPKADTQIYLRPEDPAWLEAERALWWSISCRDFSKRQKRLLTFILKESIGRCRGKAYVSSLESFNEYTRLQVSHVSETLKFLKSARVIAEYPQGCYGFRFPIGAWEVQVLPERMYHDEQFALIEAPRDLEDALREVFIDDIKNLPARGPLKRAVHPNRSNPGPGPDREATGGVVSREPAGSVRDDHAVATEGAQFPQGRPPTSSKGNPGHKSFPESGNATRPADDFPNRETPKSAMATARAAIFPDSGNPHAYASDVREMFVQKDIPACTTSVPESGNAAKLDRERQELLDEIGKRGGFGKDNHAKGFWLNFVRKRPQTTRELLGELRYRIQTHPSDPVKDTGKWMVDKWKRWGKPNK